ncbi:hypothetical protein SBADM41S_07985 [Streptomyces badius]
MPISPTSRDAAESPQLFSPPELNRQIWDRAAARLLAKMLGEFAYEKIIEPVPEPGTGGLHRALTPRRRRERSPSPPGVAFTAAGASTAGVDRRSRAQPAGRPSDFLTRARPTSSGLDGRRWAILIRELTLTLSADARARPHRAHRRPASPSPRTTRSWKATRPVTPGWWRARGGSASPPRDAARFTPETRSAVRLPWIAVERRPRRLSQVSSTRTSGTPPTCCGPGGTPGLLSSPYPPGRGRVDRAALRPGRRRRRLWPGTPTATPLPADVDLRPAQVNPRSRAASWSTRRRPTPSRPRPRGSSGSWSWRCPDGSKRCPKTSDTR